MVGKVLKIKRLHKINDSAIMKISAENPTTAHTLDR